PIRPNRKPTPLRQRRLQLLLSPRTKPRTRRNVAESKLHSSKLRRNLLRRKANSTSSNEKPRWIATLFIPRRTTLATRKAKPGWTPTRSRLTTKNPRWMTSRPKWRHFRLNSAKLPKPKSPRNRNDRRAKLFRLQHQWQPVLAVADDHYFRVAT